MRILYSVFISMLLFSCSTSEAPPLEEEQSKETSEKSPVAPDFSMVLGDWKVEGEPMFESWTKSDGSDNSENFTVIMSGYSHYNNGVDSVPIEIMNVVDRNGKYYLDAIVIMQNEGHPVSFELTKHSAELMQFENQEHDFPKVLSYAKIHTDTLGIKVGGVKDNGEEELLKYTFLRLSK